MNLAKRMANLGTETAFEVLARAKALEAEGKSVIHLEIGEPDFDTPPNVVEAGARALRTGHTHYTPSAGVPMLREAIAQEMARTRGVPVHAEQVVVCPGAKPIMFFAILALVDEGDEVVYPNPGFPIYESMIRFVGAKPVPIALPEENDFRLDVDGLVRSLTPRTRMVILNSPQNPTGGVLEKADLKRIAEAVAKLPNCWVLSDEIYRRILYVPGEHPSILAEHAMRDRTIVLDGFSKAFAMTGWRLGYGVMPKELAVHVARLMTNSNSCTATFTQIAGVEALNGDQSSVTKMVEEFRRRRDAIVAGLNRVKGFRCRTPKGAFYVFPNITGTGRKSKELQDLLLNEIGVACLSGTSFGEKGEGYLRFSYANSLERIEAAVERLVRHFGSA
ncbi:MAG TPA: pyridoxal phosphate-dependent aminotransferase [Planctomycetota bacterium]|nr:pyridoxal phosphate-dependent aminotransferase [Planctomycetota bacterium]